MKPKIASGLAVAALTVWLCPAGPAAAGVLQRVTAVQGPAPLIDPLDPFPELFSVPPSLLPGGFTDSDEQQVFAATSAGITTNILAQVSGSTGFGPYSGAAAAGAFGDVGLATRILEEVPTGEMSAARVLIASDEFVNVTGAPRAAAARFIVDGGSLQGARASYRLIVGASNLGNVPITTSLDDLEFLLTFVDALFFFDSGFASQGTLRTEAGVSQYGVFNDPSATQTSDLGAVFDPALRRVDIPLSLQTFEIGILQPGDRLLLFYSLYLESATVGGVSASALFSDPLSLDGNANFPQVSLRPLAAIPEAATLPLLALGLGGLALGLLRARPSRSR
jgi:hypothetical protein